MSDWDEHEPDWLMTFSPVMRVCETCGFTQYWSNDKWMQGHRDDMPNPHPAEPAPPTVEGTPRACLAAFAATMISAFWWVVTFDPAAAVVGQLCAVLTVGIYLLARRPRGSGGPSPVAHLKSRATDA